MGVFGIWCWSADHVVMQLNESHHNRQNGKGSDGGGFDLDGSTTDSIVQYNYSHDNDGAGVLLAQFQGARQGGVFKDNIVRYNVSERDAQRGEYGAITLWGASFEDSIGRSEIYNNTIYVVPATRGGKASAVRFMGPYIKDIKMMNNIFYATGGVRMIDLPGGGDKASIKFLRNDYYADGAPVKISWDGKDYPSLGSWAGAGAAKQEMEDGKNLALSLNPGLTAPGQGALQGRPKVLASLKAYTLLPTSPLRDLGLDLQKRGGMLGPWAGKDLYNTNTPRGAGYELGAAELP
jgi:hypothetical protein